MHRLSAFGTHGFVGQDVPAGVTGKLPLAHQANEPLFSIPGLSVLVISLGVANGAADSMKRPARRGFHGFPVSSGRLEGDCPIPGTPPARGDSSYNEETALGKVPLLFMFPITNCSWRNFRRDLLQIGEHHVKIVKRHRRECGGKDGVERRLKGKTSVGMRNSSCLRRIESGGSLCGRRFPRLLAGGCRHGRDGLAAASPAMGRPKI